MTRHPLPLAWITTLAIASACGDNVATTEATDSSSSSSTTTTSTTDPGTSSPTTGTPGTTGTTTGEPTTGSTSSSTGTTDMVTASSSSTTDATGTSTDTTDTTDTTETSTGSTTETSTGSTTETSTGVLPCENGVQDQDETDIDCGGLVCGPCANGQACSEHSDCQSQACVGGLCVAPGCLSDDDCVTTCSDGTCDLDTFTCIPSPKNEGMPCGEGDLCMSGKTCAAGECVGGQPKDCAALDTVCGTGTCDPGTGACITGPDPDKDGLDCDDGNACTLASTCQNGVCGDPQDPGYLFHENFSNPHPGWQLDETWEIGTAKNSPVGGAKTGRDPTLDHTAGDDNKLAGQYIGELLSTENTTPGNFHCLTSPPIDADGMPELWLTFWRHLHTDVAPYAVSRIEVFDGADWILLEEGYGPLVVNDEEWTEVKFDLSAHANAELQVRICHQRNLLAYKYGGWSVDDFTIGPISCTP